MLAPFTQIPSHLHTIADYQQQARQHLSTEVWSYLEGGAMDEISLNTNLKSYQDIRLLPRHLNDVTTLDTHIELFGHRYAHPIFLAPVGYQKLFHPHGEIATAMAAEALNANMVLSQFTTTHLQDVAKASQGSKWFQLYWQDSRQQALEFIHQAQASGYLAIVITIDSAFSGIRDRERKSGFQLPSHLSTPHHQAQHLARPDLQGLMQLAPKWQDIAWLIEQSELPIILKGILHPLDAKQAYEMGVQGIIVSNHGGRILDGAVSPLDVLPQIKKILPKDYPILIDGGIRRGTDIFKALSLGASAVLIGRPYLYGLAAAGALGVAHTLKILQEEFLTTMALMGTNQIDQINSDLIFQK